MLTASFYGGFMINFISLISGSSGNCSFISDGKTNILIDCGTSCKKIEEALRSIDIMPESLDALLITHEHTDHVKAAGTLSKKYNLNVYATEMTHLTDKMPKINDDLRHFVSPITDIEIGTIGVQPFSISHDAADPVGYSFYIGSEKISIATDTGFVSDELMAHIGGSSMIILESNHDVEMLRCGSYPYPLKQRILSDFGHLSNETAAQAALELVNSGTRHIMLGHLSEHNNLPEIAMMETYNTLTAAGVEIGKDVTLQVADRYKITRFKE